MPRHTPPPPCLPEHSHPVETLTCPLVAPWENPLSEALDGSGDRQQRAGSLRSWGLMWELWPHPQAGVPRGIAE